MAQNEISSKMETIGNCQHILLLMITNVIDLGTFDFKLNRIAGISYVYNNNCFQTRTCK